MITEIRKSSVLQKCSCGAENEINYEDIRFKPSPDQFVLPVCKKCKSRIEFIFVSETMRKEEFQLMVKMKQLGLME